MSKGATIKYTSQCRKCWGKGQIFLGLTAYPCDACSSTGQITGSNQCKYCGDPCDGYYCKSCYKVFRG